jgi:hypothetical protein
MAATLRPQLDRLMGVRAALVELRPAVEDGEPWQLAEHFGVEPEASWGPPEVLAHLAEMLPYWYAQMQLVLDGRAEPVPFGRTADDPTRLRAIERDRSLRAAKLFDRIEAGIRPYWWLLPRLTKADVARVGLHPRRGEMAVPEILEVLVVGHAEDHVTQLRETLAAR